MRARDTLPPEIARDIEAMEAAVAGRPHDDGDPMLAELAVRVAESRPLLDPVRAEALDARRPFNPPAASRPQRLAALRRQLLGPGLALGACAVLVVALVVARSGGPVRDISSGGGGGIAATSPDRSAESAGSSGSVGSGSIAVPPAPSPGDARSDGRQARKVERSATMRLGARRRDVDEVADGAARVATSLGGFVASSSISSRHGGSLELRVPTARLDQAIERLSRLARVRELERNTVDITAQAVSARARLTDAKTERRSLLRQLDDATTLDEVERLRARLRRVSREIEAARADVRRVDNRASYANIGVTIVPEKREAAAAGDGWSPGDAWHDALRVLEVAAGIALVALAVALPFALLGAPAWIAGRRLTRRRRERALDLA